MSGGNGKMAMIKGRKTGNVHLRLDVQENSTQRSQHPACRGCISLPTREKARVLLSTQHPGCGQRLALNDDVLSSVRCLMSLVSVQRRVP